MEEDLAKKMIQTKGLPRHTDKSITDPDRFIDEVRATKQKGYATDYGEYITGVRAVAAPIDGYKSRLAAIWVVGFKASLDNSKMNVLEKEIRKTVEKINHRLQEEPGLRIKKGL
jgi:IclR family acetate operon transcriptional repressor